MPHVIIVIWNGGSFTSLNFSQNSFANCRKTYYWHTTDSFDNYIVFSILLLKILVIIISYYNVSISICPYLSP